MKELRMKDALGLVKTWGRTYWDEQDGVLYANYTCGAFEVDFQGTELTVEFAAVPDTFVPPSAAGEQPPREDWPFSTAAASPSAASGFGTGSACACFRPGRRSAIESAW